MADFTILKRELRKVFNPNKDVQVVHIGNPETAYLIGKTKDGYLVTTMVDSEELYVCTL